MDKNNGILCLCVHVGGGGGGLEVLKKIELAMNNLLMYRCSSWSSILVSRVHHSQLCLSLMDQWRFWEHLLHCDVAERQLCVQQHHHN